MPGSKCKLLWQDLTSAKIAAQAIARLTVDVADFAHRVTIRIRALRKATSGSNCVLTWLSHQMTGIRAGCKGDE